MMEVQFHSKSTKVKQLAEIPSVNPLLMENSKREKNWPSINEMSLRYQWARDTVFQGFFRN